MSRVPSESFSIQRHHTKKNQHILVPNDTTCRSPEKSVSHLCLYHPISVHQGHDRNYGLSSGPPGGEGGGGNKHSLLHVIIVLYKIRHLYTMSPVGAEAGKGGWWYRCECASTAPTLYFPGCHGLQRPMACRSLTSFKLRRRNLRSFGSALATAPSVTLTVLLIQRVGFGSRRFGVY